jgi:hypothetical protein
MNKKDLLHHIATAGYNAGFGAKKSFASLDTLSKAPSVLGWSLTSVGVLGLAFDCLSTKAVSAITLSIGFISFYLSYKERDLKKFETSGVELTRIRDELGILYARVGAVEDIAPESYVEQLEALQKRASGSAVSDQVMFSGWYAHMKFFGESQIEWINKELKFRFWKDMVPTSAKLVGFLILFSALVFRLFFAPFPDQKIITQPSPPPLPAPASPGLPIPAAP